ncbi:hypothetical protein C8Q73DRAFT_326423 [Cubamyces lactineus]|nr:hypothetical protein C8Q73DRAFT_326423 [Cubamyces lactineus]
MVVSRAAYTDRRWYRTELDRTTDSRIAGSWITYTLTQPSRLAFLSLLSLTLSLFSRLFVLNTNDHARSRPPSISLSIHPLYHPHPHPHPHPSLPLNLPSALLSPLHRSTPCSSLISTISRACHAYSIPHFAHIPSYLSSRLSCILHNTANSKSPSSISLPVRRLRQHHQSLHDTPPHRINCNRSFSIRFYFHPLLILNPPYRLLNIPNPTCPLFTA